MDSIVDTTMRLAKQNPEFGRILNVLNRTLDRHSIQKDRFDLAEVLLHQRMNPKILIGTNDPDFGSLRAIVKDFRAELKKEMLPPIKYLVFVYGTLKRGLALHSHMAGQKFLDEAETLPQYRMYLPRKQGWFPCLAQEEDGVSIQGELWEVDEKHLLTLDRVEGSLFSRTFVSLAPPHDQEVVLAYLYKYKITAKEFIDCGTNWQGAEAFVTEEDTCWESLEEAND